MEPNQEQSQSEQASSQPEQATPQATELNNKRTFAVLGYVIPILFFLPLLTDKTKNDPFARFHANQQLILLLVCVAFQFMAANVFMAFMQVMYLIDIVYLALLALVIFGAYNAYKGEMKELPVIGQFKIL